MHASQGVTFDKLDVGAGIRYKDLDLLPHHHRVQVEYVLSLINSCILAAQVCVCARVTSTSSRCSRSPWFGMLCRVGVCAVVARRRNTAVCQPPSQYCAPPTCGPHCAGLLRYRTTCTCDFPPQRAPPVVSSAHGSCYACVWLDSVHRSVSAGGNSPRFGGAHGGHGQCCRCGWHNAARQGSDGVDKVKWIAACRLVGARAVVSTSRCVLVVCRGWVCRLVWRAVARVFMDRVRTSA